MTPCATVKLHQVGRLASAAACELQGALAAVPALWKPHLGTLGDQHQCQHLGSSQSAGPCTALHVSKKLPLPIRYV